MVYALRPPGGSLSGLGQGVSVLLWTMVMLACLVAAAAFSGAQSAPQEAAAIGIAVIPYVFARAWDGMRNA